MLIPILILQSLCGPNPSYFSEIYTNLRWKKPLRIQQVNTPAFYQSLIEVRKFTEIEVDNNPLIKISINSRDQYIQQFNAAAVTYNWTEGNEITSSLIVFANSFFMENGRNNTFLHEIGHVLGLKHSPISSDVMSINKVRREERSFGLFEKDCLEYIYWYKSNGEKNDETRGLFVVIE